MIRDTIPATNSPKSTGSRPAGAWNANVASVIGASSCQLVIFSCVVSEPGACR
jgi:hypothetical protein